MYIHNTIVLKIFANHKVAIMAIQFLSHVKTLPSCPSDVRLRGSRRRMYLLVPLLQTLYKELNSFNHTIKT